MSFLGRADVVVVVPTRNRVASLARALAALGAARRAFHGCVAVVVVDDGSTDDTPRVIEQARHAGVVEVGLRNPTSRGPAAARNRGWRSIDAPLVAFTDDDCEVSADWLVTLARALADAPPERAAVGGRVVPGGTGLVSTYMTTHRILEPPASRAYVVTANCMFGRSALEAAGGFDEAIRTPGGEDPGICLKLGKLGYTFEFAPSAVVTHHYREGLRDFLWTFYRYGKGCRIVMDP